MGMYDSFIDKDRTIEVQLKVGPCLMDNYYPGDLADAFPDAFPDGIYHDYGGVVAIQNRTVLAVAKQLPADLVVAGLTHYTKWGGYFDPEVDDLNNHNPFAQGPWCKLSPEKK